MEFSSHSNCFIVQILNNPRIVNITPQSPLYDLLILVYNQGRVLVAKQRDTPDKNNQGRVQFTMIKEECTYEDEKAVNQNIDCYISMFIL